MAERIKIAIIGGGTAGWMTAAALASLATDRICDLVLVESEAIGTVGVGEATIPAIKDFNDLLGIPERDFMRFTQATFKLGIEFSGWGRQNTSYIHPFGTFGDTIAGSDFHQQWLRFSHSAETKPLEAYSLAVQMCRHNRFKFPGRKSGEDTIATDSRFAYAYHFDAGLYARYLRLFSERKGVRRIEGRITGAQLNRDSGDIEGVLLKSGQRIDADYFIDCSGFRSLLLGERLGVRYESWKHWLPCDSAVAMPSERNPELPPVTRATAKAVGWQWQIPLQHRTGNGLVFQSGLMSEDEAVTSLQQSVGGHSGSRPRVIHFEAGKRSCSWYKNCIAIGLAAGFLEPLESTSIYLIQSAIAHFLALLPGKLAPPQLVREFNRQVDLEYERARDFIILHYHLNQRDDSELWHYCRSMNIPDSLRGRIDAFRKRGYIEQYRFGLFAPPSWLSVMMGQGLMPEKADPLSATVDTTLAQRTMAEQFEAVQQALGTMVSSREFVGNYCATAPMETAALETTK
ncbi:tryptophan halogenase family protein [Microbulbifer sp.]|uniref:tryptophan halogenase family protein n=1 Tax=Microbulbifer sp. TaxID=1908541 RepID=UPI002590B7D8|nr:tryptophan halogenase family protein [Microbulbifer sp.]